MKLLKLLAAPVVVILGVVMAVPAFAHGISNATLAVGCGQGDQTGKICITLSGDIEDNQDERILVFQVFAVSDQSKSLGEVSFDIPANHSGSDVHLNPPLKECFPAITNSAGPFVVKLVKVTDKSGNAADFEFRAPNNNNPFIDVDTAEDVPVSVGQTNACPAPSTPTPTPTATPATTTLAGTGGFDFRFALIGLTALVAGVTLFVISASRGRSTTK